MKPKVCVIGDCFLDVTRKVKVRGPSPESPEAPVLQYLYEMYGLGGAGNVANWLSRAGECDVTLFSPWSTYSAWLEEYTELLEFNNIQRGLPLRWGHGEAVKIRFLSHEDGDCIQYHCRIDEESLGDLTRQERLFIGTALANDPFDAVVLVDYEKWSFQGKEGEQLQKFLKSYAFTCQKPVFVNSKRPDRWTEFGATALLCNRTEADQFGGYDLEDAVSTVKAGLVVVTLGKEGVCSFLPQEGGHLLRKAFPTRATSVIDVTGAGDAFLAGFVASSVENRWWGRSPRIQEELTATAIEVGLRWAARCCAQVGCGDPTQRLEWEKQDA